MKMKINTVRKKTSGARRLMAMMGVGFLVVAWSCGLVGAAETRYVNKDNPFPNAPFTRWEDAAVTIQDAIDVAGVGDLILVTNGIYDTGGKTNWPAGSAVTNRVTLTNSVTVQAVSTNPAHTVIVGAPDPVTGGLGVGAVRCAYVQSGCTLAGFTLTNGYTQAGTADAVSRRGGGVYGAGATSWLSNCVVVACQAGFNGGGAYNASLFRCVLTGNTATNGGGGHSVRAYWSEIRNNRAMNQGGGLYGTYAGNSVIAENRGGAYGGGLAGTLTAVDCVIVSNSTPSYGGGYGQSGYGLTASNCVFAYNWCGGQGSAVQGGARVVNCLAMRNTGGYAFRDSYLYNCTVVSNSGGLQQSTRATNCIIYYNGNDLGSSGLAVGYCCYGRTTYPLTGENNITNAPVFVDMEALNFRLVRGSLGINAGTNIAWLSDVPDLDGNLRIHEGLVDMGAYEAVPVPYLLNGGASEIGADRATLNGDLIFTGTAAAVVWAYWGTSDGGTNKNAWAANACLNERELGALSHVATPLAPDTLYYFTYYASNEFGGFWPHAGPVQFSTAGAPAVTNTGAVTARNTYMDLSGEVLVGYPAPSVWIYWGESDAEEDPALWEHSTFVGVVTNWTFTATVDVRPDRTYYYRCLVSNEHGVNWSSAATPFTLSGVHYVNKNNPTPASPYLSWTDAATNIQDAIDAAGVGDVVLVTNGVYETGERAFSTIGSNRVAVTNALTVMAVSTNPADTSIAGAPDLRGGAPSHGTTAVRAVYLGTGSTLRGFTVSNGYVSVWGTAANGRGGGVYADTGAVLTNCVVMDCRGYTGGGVYGNASNVIVDCVVSNNYGGIGGGVYVASDSLVRMSLLVTNRAANGSGGGIYAGARCRVEGCTVSRNVSLQSGGGVRLVGASELRDSTVDNNRGEATSGNYYGAGVCGDNGASVISNCVILFNSSRFVSGSGGLHGGGVGQGSYYDCVVVSNSTPSGYNGGGAAAGRYYGCQIVFNNGHTGSGVYNPLLAQDCLIQGNNGYAAAYWGVYDRCRIIDNTGHGVSGHYTLGNSPSATVMNSLVARNTGYGLWNNVYAINCTIVSNFGRGVSSHGAFTTGSLSNCIVHGNVPANFANGTFSIHYSCFTNDNASATVVGANNLEADPKFVDALSGHYRLSADSPCIDQGLNASWMGASKDLGGTNCRIVNATVDMGAYEYSDGSLNASFGADPRDSLAPTLNTFTALASETNMAALHYQWDFDNDGSVDWAGWGQDVVTHSYTKPGYYSSVLTVSNGLGQTCSFTNLLYIKAGPITYYVAKEGPEIYPYTNWNVAASNLPPVFGLLSDGDTVAVGPGFYEQSAQLKLSVGAAVTSVNGAVATTLARPASAGSFRVLQLNHASAELGGFTIANGSLTAANSDGGGVYVSLGLLNRCVVSNCYTSRDGAGVYLNNSAAARVRNCVLAGNTAARFGGGAAVNKSGTLESCTIAGNTASNAGGGVAAVALPGMLVMNSVVYGNTSPVSNNWMVAGAGSYAFTNCLTEPTDGLNGAGNLDADPQLKNPSAGNYRLGAGSPGFNAGEYQDWMATAEDLDGRPRVLFDAPDIGAYEYPTRHTGAVIVVK